MAIKREQVNRLTQKLFGDVLQVDVLFFLCFAFEIMKGYATDYEIEEYDRAKAEQYPPLHAEMLQQSSYSSVRRNGASNDGNGTTLTRRSRRAYLSALYHIVHVICGYILRLLAVSRFVCYMKISGSR